ncbi:hypothetical protein V8G54_030866 [Vigna mungo]|uniref:Uncharacterized protein n=1 Tax=Vigna mungo TaxID=3915 RepID=A0AAQ3MXJ2_VIGMU
MRWIRDSMRAMSSDLAAAEMLGEMELWERMGPGLPFIMQAQPYLNAVPMPIGLEGVCLKACTHYPTLFDHFQRELRAGSCEKDSTTQECPRRFRNGLGKGQSNTAQD